MAANTAIEWCDCTFSPWVGCTKVSAACDHCYAEGWAKRTGKPELWAGERRRTTAAYWRQPEKWNREAADAPRRPRVFCASLADVFDNQVPDEWRTDLWQLIHRTPNLDWLLLTKRPQNIAKMLPQLTEMVPPNIWLGTTVENQEEADRRIPHLLKVPARVHFLSCEPLLAPVDLWNVQGHDGGRLNALSPIHGNRVGWVICGGESGGQARWMDPIWAGWLRDQCSFAGAPFFMKQMTRKAEIPFDLQVREFPR